MNPPATPRRFVFVRDVDYTGMSGTGTVAEGVEWTDGTVTLRWRGTRSSVVHWQCIDDAEAIHGHHGATRVEWLDPAINGASTDLAEMLRPQPGRRRPSLAERAYIAFCLLGAVALVVFAVVWTA